MPGSCSSGFRSRPSAARGQQAVERVGGEQHEGEEAGADQAHHAEHARGHVLGQVRAEQAHRHHPHARASGTTAAASPRGRPRRRRRGSAAAARCWNCIATYGTEKSLVTNDAGEAAEGERDEQRLRLRRRPRDAIQAALPRAAPTSGTTPWTSATHEREAQRELSELRDHGLPSCSVFVRLFHRVRPPPAACSSRRAWRAPRARGTRRRRRAGPAPPRPCPRGTDPAARRGRPPGWSSRCRSRRSAPRRRRA